MVEREESDPDDRSAQALQLFLGTLWSMVVDEDNYADGYPSWLEPGLRGHQQGNGPADAGASALQRVLACGVDPDDLTDLVREMQHEVLYNVCQLIDDPGLLGIGLDHEGARPADFRWELVAVRDEEPAGRAPVHGLHSSLDELDPSGRHGEPRGRPIPARLPGHPLHARLALAHARTGDRIQAIKTWRKATGATVTEAKAAIDLLLDRAGEGPGSAH
ncbi:hypothetical protein [Streptomyces sp. NBC_01363]|uniref:hypothetical protein n=1 Tax=Streptomyces sp. NBC_01363 TaxID=2903840 RepID=UPI0022599BF4|nr:hypothetical protein [Streptomyces sp. NBC_01363]MCX4732065.1 hypothetical protein [Streptomyces sp. NBC_01363]